MTKIGIDIGGVIVDGSSRDTDTSVFGENFLLTPMNDDVIYSIHRLTEKFGSENVFIVSKCGKRIQERSLAWLDHQNFWTLTGMRPENVYFCKRRHEKAGICEQLGITLFIDDRLEVLSHMKSVPHKILFKSDPKEIAKFQEHAAGVYIVETWCEVLTQVFGD